MVRTCLIGLGLAFLLFGICGSFSLLGDIISHTLGLRAAGIPVTWSTLMEGSPRYGHLGLLWILGGICCLAGARLVGRAYLLRQALKERMDRQAGQSIILVAAILAALFVFAAIAVDGARAYYMRRQMQNAADFGALAGVYETCLEGTSYELRQNADAKAREFAIRNEASEPITVTVDLAAHTVDVTTTVTFSTYFAGFIGFHELDTGAYAKAEAICPLAKYVVWAHSDDCNTTIDWSGNDIDADGDVHSNHDFKMGGQGNDISGLAEYVTDVQYNQGNAIDPMQVAYDPGWPVWFDIADFQPGGSAANAAGSQYHYYNRNLRMNNADFIPPGLYFVDGNVDINGTDLAGRITIVATGKIKFSGANHSFEPFYDGLFLFSNQYWPQGNKHCADAVIDVACSGCRYEGIIFAPGGLVQYAGSDLSVLDGAIVAYTIGLDGSGYTLTGGVEKRRLPLVRLIE